MNSSFRTVKTLGSKHHCRMLFGLGHDPEKGMRLEDFETTTTMVLRDQSVSQVMPGVFAKGGLDEATALLLRVLPELGAPGRALDFACGTGPIAHHLLTCFPQSKVTMSVRMRLPCIMRD